jgi:hypothetical protein
MVFYCKKCNAKLSAGPDEIGEEFECPVCNTVQLVPGDKPEAKAPASKPSGPVVRIPKKKIVIPNPVTEDDDDDEELEEEIEEEIGGSGLRVFATAVCTAGVMLFIMVILWFFLRPAASQTDVREWFVVILAFTSLLLLALMGVVVAVMAFRVERIMAYVRHLGAEED